MAVTSRFYAYPLLMALLHSLYMCRLWWEYHQTSCDPSSDVEMKSLLQASCQRSEIHRWVILCCIQRYTKSAKMDSGVEQGSLLCTNRSGPGFPYLVWAPTGEIPGGGRQKSEGQKGGTTNEVDEETARAVQCWVELCARNRG
jgi:hypothetical protein